MSDGPVDLPYGAFLTRTLRSTVGATRDELVGEEARNDGPARSASARKWCPTGW